MTHINQRRDTAANWTAADPVLKLGEVGWETDTLKAKLGNGTDPWSVLDYAVQPPPAIPPIPPFPVVTDLSASAAAVRLLSKLDANHGDASLVYVGDSTTAIYGTPWTTRIADMLADRYPEYTVKIAQWNGDNTPYTDPGAYGSWTTLQIGTGSHTLWVYNGGAGGSNLFYPLTQLAAMVRVPNPDMVMIDHGANQVLFTSTHTPDDFRASYLCLTEAIREALPATPILCISQHVITTPGAPDSFIVAEMVRQVCEVRGYSYVNMTQVSADIPTWAADYMQDTAHANDAGQIVWADTIWDRVFSDETRPEIVPQLPSSFIQPSGHDLLVNGSFTAFDGVNAPVGWVVANATPSKDLVNFENTYGLNYAYKMVSLGTGVAATYQGVLPTILERVKGKYVTLTARVRINSPAPDVSSLRGTLQLYDGVTAVAGIYDMWSEGAFIYHSVTLRVDEAATQLTAYLICDNLGTNVGTSNTWEWVTLVEGVIPSCPEFVAGQFIRYSYAQTLNDAQKQQAAVNGGFRRTPEGVVETGKYWILAGAGGVSTMALTASREYAVPFEITSEVTINELDVEVTTAAAASAVRLGIRAHNPLTGEPKGGAPLVDAGTIDSTTTGVKPKAISSLNLKPGWYWYTVTAQGGAPTVRASLPYAVIAPMPTKATTAAALSQFNICGYYQDGVTGALPSTWASTSNAFGAPRMLAKQV
jgi:lysophospholipase L1-like esterase